VGIRLSGKKDITRITPGQTASYDAHTQQLTVSEKDLDEAALWRYEALNIENATIETLCRKIESWYGVHITLANHSAKVHQYTLKLTHEPLEEVLELMSKLGNISYKIEGKEVTITYK
jgi:ferric-dicitrate binding protein FerR (iron transport regulator)